VTDRRPYAAFSLACAPGAVALSLILFRATGFLTGSASGGDAGPAAILGLIVIGFDAIMVLWFTAPGVVLAVNAFSQGPPRGAAILAFAVSALTPLWVILAAQYMDATLAPLRPSSSPLHRRPGFPGGRWAPPSASSWQAPGSARPSRRSCLAIRSLAGSGARSS